MDEEKILNLLHIARKAGKLQFGYGACERSCTNGNSKLCRKYQEEPEDNG
ncbi:MAG: hypothetical protein K8R49_06370 [Candidatus Cloacimonetes bacterium]|nr:hypothetical protein [Candidatus Cloacimonadota bacterium]